MDAKILTAQIVAFWQQTDAFRQSIAQNSEKLSYTFYDGPPFTSGDPHYGHILQSVVKDVVPRRMSMRGYRVERTRGRDCHGIPAENYVNKQLGITSKRQVEEEFGLQNYVEACRSMVNNVNDARKIMIDRIGRWVDMDNAYFTMDNDYMESVICLFSDLYHRNVIYTGFKVLGYSRALGTALSNSEIADSYEMRQDHAVTVKMPVSIPKTPGGPQQQRGDDGAREVVAGIIKDEKGRMLMLFENKHNMWFSPGGKIEHNETPADALKREVLEELDVQVVTEQFLGHTKTIHAGRLYRLHYFALTITGTPTIQEPEKHGMCAWIEKIPADNEFGYVLKFADLIIDDVRQMHREFGDIHMLAQGITDFPESGQASIFVLPWTTTPRTLPANMFVAVHREIDYIQVFDRATKEYYMLAENCLSKYYQSVDEYIHIATCRGSELLGLQYTPLYTYYHDKKTIADTYKQRVHTILHADFVTTESGTGVVHEAPAFGADDYELVASLLGKDNAQDWLFDPVNEHGEFTADVPDFAGQNVFDANKPIVADLKTRGLLVRQETINHSYPHCPRTQTPLIYKAIESWFVKEEDLKTATVPAAEAIQFVPEGVKQRFINGLMSAPDRNISRTRYRGAPLPVWVSHDGAITKVVGSLEEIYQLNKPTKQLTKLILIGHGRATSNEEQWVDYRPHDKARLSALGEQQTVRISDALLPEDIDVIYRSPLTRCAQTLAPYLNTLGKTAIIDERLKELDFGTYQGRRFDRTITRDGGPVDGAVGESIQEVARRMEAFLQDICHKHAGQTVVICSHGDPLCLLDRFMRDMTYEAAKRLKYISNKSLETLPIRTRYVRSDTGKGLDLHRPYIDRITLIDPDSNQELDRIPEVLDCRFESGAMPYGQDHWMKSNITAGVDLILVDAAKGIIACDTNYSLESFALNTELADFLATLSPKKVVVTNVGGPKRHRMEELLATYGFELFSLENAPSKEDPTYFSTLLMHYQVDPTRIVYFDHTPQALESAKQAGIHHAFQSLDTKQICVQLERMIASQVSSLKSQVSFTNCADFIAEGLDQTRGWFRALHVLGHAYHGQNVFKHVVVTGLILAEDGKKMSKSLQNFPDPSYLLDQYGADALRLYLLGSPVVKAEPLRFSEKGVEQMMKDVVIPLENVCNFFTMYAEVDQRKDQGTQVWFMRHALKNTIAVEGETPTGAWITQEGETVEDCDIPLSKEGFAQLASPEFIETVLRIRPEVIVCSEFLRAQQTATGVVEVMNTYLGQAVEVVVDTARGRGAKCDEQYDKINTKALGEYSDNAKSIGTTYQDTLITYAGKRVLVVSHKRRFRYLWQWLGDIQKDINTSPALQTYSIASAQVVPLPRTRVCNELDQRVLAELHRTSAGVSNALLDYHLQEATDFLISFVDKLTNRYLRRSRRRFRTEAMIDDKHQAYQTLFTALRTYLQLCAPFIPFVTEQLWQKLQSFTNGTARHPSIHLQPRPIGADVYINEALIEEIETVRKIIKGALYLRAKHQIKVKQPLPTLAFRI